MFDVKITIGTTTELGTTLNRIADALSGQCTPAPAVNSGNQSVAAVSAPAPAPAPAAPAPVPAPAGPIAQPAAPAVPVAQPVAAPVPAAQPAPAPAVPVAQTAAPTYTKEQVAAAGAALIGQPTGAIRQTGHVSACFLARPTARTVSLTPPAAGASGRWTSTSAPG